MKYANRADLLIAAGESIKMQEEAGIEPMCKTNYSGSSCDICKISEAAFMESSWQEANYEFPLAVVKGKPVFVGDELWAKSGYAIKAENGVNFSHCSWNPPKPKTVMVELLREDAEYWISYDVDYANLGTPPSRYKTASENFYKSVREAMKK